MEKSPLQFVYLHKRIDHNRQGYRRMTVSNPQDENALEAIRREAAMWLLRTEQPDCSDDDEFEAWLARSAQHRRLWNDTCLTGELLATSPLHYERITPPRLPEKSSRSTTRQARNIRSPKPWRMAHAGMAAVVSAVLCLTAYVTMPALLIDWQADFRTATGQTRSITLEDGSLVNLGADSAIKVDYTVGKREVVLLTGEAFFEVARNAARPFTVAADGMKVEVLGTAFDVRLGKDATEVALLHGSVRASASETHNLDIEMLVPGDRLTIDRRSGDVSVQKVSPDAIGSWQNGRLLITNSSIDAVIEQIQRYSPFWITILDRSLAKTRVSGVYDILNPDEALTALVSPFGGKVRVIAGVGRVISRF